VADAEQLGAAVLLAHVAPRASRGAVDVFDEVARLVEPARAEVDREHHFRPRGVAPIGKFVDADGVRFGGVPGEVEPRRPLRARAHAVFPIVGGDEVAAWIANDRDFELLDERDHVLAHAVGVGGLVAGLVNAGVNRPSEVLEERAIEPVIDFRDCVVSIGRDRGAHVSFPSISKSWIYSTRFVKRKHIRARTRISQAIRWKFRQAAGDPRSRSHSGSPESISRLLIESPWRLALSSLPSSRKTSPKGRGYDRPPDGGTRQVILGRKAR
jgi:hypothetical protein